jgi:hypothetical protein
MFTSLRGVTYRVANLELAKQWYRQLLAREPALDTQLAVTFQVGDSVLTLLPAEGGSDETGERVVAYWAVEDINAAFQSMLDAGARPQCEIMTSMLNTKLARVVDPFGNVLGITARISDASSTSLENQPSDSAMGVAFFRALATFDEREEVRGPDYLAQVFLPEDYKKLVNNPSSRAFVMRRMKTQTPGSYEYFVARTAYIDRDGSAGARGRYAATGNPWGGVRHEIVPFQGPHPERQGFRTRHCTHAAVQETHAAES